VLAADGWSFGISWPVGWGLVVVEWAASWVAGVAVAVGMAVAVAAGVGVAPVVVDDWPALGWLPGTAAAGGCAPLSGGVLLDGLAEDAWLDAPDWAAAPDEAGWLAALGWLAEPEELDWLAVLGEELDAPPEAGAALDELGAAPEAGAAFVGLDPPDWLDCFDGPPALDAPVALERLAEPLA